MNRFDYIRPETVAEAVNALQMGNSSALAGGTNIVDLLKYNVANPATIVDINRLPLRSMRTAEDGSLSIGALVSNSEIAWSDNVRSNWPLLSSAVLAGASPQLRNAATTGGNILQRTRCYYFYDTSTPCNKRVPGTGCSAIGGVNRIHAVLGASDKCIAVHPSDMCVALAALAAEVEVEGANGRRLVPFQEFHRLPASAPDRDNTMEAGELITSVRLARFDAGDHYTYLKVRDRLSYAFALVSVAVALEIESGTIKHARIALGGVAHKPWRDVDAETMLEDTSPSQELFERVANRILEGARGCGHNDFKIDLARRAVVRALQQAADGTPQNQAQKSFR